MKVVLPMAGFGTRLRPLTWSKPKPLVPVAGKPVVGHVLDMFTTLPNLEEVVFIVGYLGERVQEYVRRAYPGLHGRYVEQKDLLGQSQAIWLAREHLRGPILISFVDTLMENNLQHALKNPADAIAWVKRIENPRRFGVAELGPDGLVKRLVEKPGDAQNNLVVVGCYYIPSGENLIAAIQRQMDEGIRLGEEFFLADALNILLAGGLRMRVEEVTVWEDCGKPETLLHANRYLLEHGKDNSAASRREGVVIVPPVFIDPDAVVERSIIGPHVSLAAGCRIENSIIRNSIVDERAEISRMVISESLVGCQARLAGRFGSFLVGDSSEVWFEKPDQAT
jgi:glucose-1-phosphate thymidylyltransferase